MRILCLEPGNYPDYETIWNEETELGPVTHFHYRKAYGFSDQTQWFWTWDILKEHYHNKDPKLLEVYDQIRQLMKKHDILYHKVGDMMHPEFIREFSHRFGAKTYTIYQIDGEPASSHILSHPVVWAYDFALTCSKHFDETRHCDEVLKEVGAWDASYIDVGTKYNRGNACWKRPVDNERDIDVVFLGGDLKICKLDMPYPPNKYLMLYYLMARTPDLKWCVEEWKGLDAASKIYQRAKIGIVLHGPTQYQIGSAQRTWDLAANGVFVISDGAQFHFDEIFTKDEAVAIDYRNPQGFLDNIRYYLANPELRIEMAQKAKQKTFEQYCDEDYMERGIKIAIEAWKKGEMWDENLK